MTDLRRHVPPVTLTWDAEAPGALWRCVEGTLVFADVSGFTALTERLARRGRIGAEEIVETLNRVFGPMLTIAAGRGGELLKFGGDALLFLFRGADHAEQACDAAVEMRAALRVAAHVPTSVGRVSLSMSVGVHSGPVHLFLVGQPTRELLVLGPAATATTRAEKAAEAGQVVVSAGTAALLPPGAVRPRGDGWLLLRRRSARTPAVGAAGPPEAGPALLSTLFPRDLGAYLADAVPDPEHRMACIAFVRFSGTDALLAGPGPDALAEALDRTVSLVEQALAAEGVTMLATDLDSDGAKFFLGSGLPAAREDDAGRMLRALRAIADADCPLPLQLGVNRGHVFAAEVGIAQRAAYTGMGDTTNTAARIMSTAPIGHLYAHPAVLEHSRTRFAVTPVGPFALKGKAVPLLAYDVGEELGTREEAAAQARLPFLGRDAELERLRSALQRALGGQGGVLSVVGGTGSGKTRLVRQALQGTQAAGLVLRAEPYGSASAYRVLRDPLRGLLGITRGEPAAMGRSLLDSLGRVAPDLLPMAPLVADVAQVEVPSTAEVEALDPQFRPDRLADAVVRLLDRALPGPLAIVAEEAHWADAASARLLDRLGRAARGRPWAVLAVRREVAGGFDPPGERITLGPLPPEVVERLVIAATEATPLRPHEIAAIVDRAEGNPLYVEEVTRVALGAGSLEALPESVGAAMSAQVDLLDPHWRRVLRCCAVLGRSFRVEVLRRTLAADGTQVAPADLDALAAFLEPDAPGRLRFRTSLVRDAAYEGLAYRVRARLHRRAGEALERMSTDLDADAATLALHFWRAGDAERTWRYAQRAGELARRASATVDAAEQYERALEVSRRVLGVSDAERAATWLLLGELRELAGILDGAREAYRRAAQLAPDEVVRARALGRQARVLERAGSYGPALRMVAGARRLLVGRTGADARRIGARLDSLVAVIRLGQERPREALRWARRAVEESRAEGDPETLADALMLVDFAEAQLGSPRLGTATREALELCIAHGYRPRESVARANLGAFAFYAGRWPEAVDWYLSSRRAALEAGNEFGAAETDISLADILIHLGRLDEAERAVREAVRVLRASGLDFYVTHGTMLLARIQLARGDLPGAAELARQAAGEFAAMGNPVSALEATLVHADVAIERQRAEEALELLARAEEAARGEAAALQARSALVRARALRDLARLEEAATAVAEGLAAARDSELPYEEARLLQLRGELVGGTQSPDAVALAQADADRAREILASLGATT